MIRKRFDKAVYILCCGLPLACLALLYGVRVGQSITTVFEVLPVQKWVLAKGSEGQIISRVTDYRSAVANDIHVVQFERGESMKFRLVPSLLPKSELAAGDTVAVIYSSRLQERLAELKGDLLVAQADLAAKRAGEKPPLVEEGKKRVEYSAARIQEKYILFERAQELFKKGYMSKEEFDAARWQLKQAELERDIDHAQLNAYQTGSKVEDLRVVRTTIEALLSEIALLETRVRDFVVQSPIAGDVILCLSSDTLLIVNNTSCLILNVPVRFEQARYLTEGDSVRIALKTIPEELTGALVAVSKEVQMINGVQILYARIALASNGYRLVPGLVVGGEIILPKVRFAEYLYALLSQ